MRHFHTLCIAFAFLLQAHLPAKSCTTILVGSALTADGSVIHAHNEDMGVEAAGRLWHVVACNFPRGTLAILPYLEIPQPESTYAYWASGNAQGTGVQGINAPYPDYNSILVGMNSWGVAMSCNWMHSREENKPEEGIRRYALRQLILERAGSAKEAVLLIGSFIEQYGQADWGGLTYCLADSREAWIVETTTHHWVAHRVRDDEIRTIANRFTITDDFELSSRELVPNAIRQGWYDPTKGSFSFRAVYGKAGMIDQHYDIDREERALSLLENKKGLITPEDLMLLLRDRYEGSPLYREPIAGKIWREFCAENNLPRPISTGICQSSSVAHLRPHLPVEVGAVLWYASATPHFSSYFPLYAGSAKVPDAFSRKDGTVKEGSAWWLFRSLQQKGDAHHTTASPNAYNFWTAQHSLTMHKQRMVEEKAFSLLNRGQRKEAQQLLDVFSYSVAEEMLLHGQRMREGLE